jgi:hypothetical protein
MTYRDPHSIATTSPRASYQKHRLAVLMIRKHFDVINRVEIYDIAM